MHDILTQRLVEDHCNKKCDDGNPECLDECMEAAELCLERSGGTLGPIFEYCMKEHGFW